MRTHQLPVTALVLALSTVALAARAEVPAPPVTAPPSAPPPAPVLTALEPVVLAPQASAPQAPIASVLEPIVPAREPPAAVTAPASTRPVRGHLEATIDARRRVVLAFYDESGVFRWRAVAWVSDPSAMLGTLSMLAGDRTEPDAEDDEVAAELAPAAPPVAPVVVVAPSAPPAAPPAAAPAQQVLQIGVASRAAAVRLAL